MIANPHKQQIPPLRCAPVGMTDYFNNFKETTLTFNQDGESRQMLSQ
jgi:hypothetical protein